MPPGRKRAAKGRKTRKKRSMSNGRGTQTNIIFRHGKKSARKKKNASKKSKKKKGRKKRPVTPNANIIFRHGKKKQRITKVGDKVLVVSLENK